MLEETPAPQSVPITTLIYRRAVEEFARYYKKSPDQLGPEQIREHQAYLFTDRKLGAIPAAQQVSALRFFLVRTLKRPVADPLASIRREELVHLKITDIDSGRMVIHLCQRICRSGRGIGQSWI